jgi:hypothetical protein
MTGTSPSRALRNASQRTSKPQETRSATRNPWALLGTFASEAVAITAILYYVGWIRADETYAYFGISLAIVGLSPTDYVLRSLPTVVPTLIGLGTLMVLWAQLHRRVVAPWIASLSPTAARQASRFCWAGAGTLLLTLGVLYLHYTQWGRWLGFGLPLLLTAAAGSAALALLFRQGQIRRGVEDPVPSLLVILGVVGVIWSLALYGVKIGQDVAADFQQNLAHNPSVTVYSEKLLVMPGIHLDEVGAGLPTARREQLQQESAYRYRYLDLRLLARIPDGYLLLPENWHKNDPVFLVPVSDNIRVDFTSSGR